MKRILNRDVDLVAMQGRWTKKFVSVYQTEEELDWRPKDTVIVFSEKDEPGPSISDNYELFASQIVSLLQLDPATCRWFEYYHGCSKPGRRTQPEAFEQVALSLLSTPSWLGTKYGDWRLVYCDPAWYDITREALEDIIGQPFER